MATTYDIDINVDSKDAVKGLTDLENETKVAANSVQGLQNELDELNNKAKGLDVSSQEFKKLSGEIKKVDGDLKNANDSLSGLSSADKAGELGKLAGGLGAVATAGALIGVGNESAEEMFKIMGTGIAITAGIQGAIEGFSAATKLATGVQAAFNAMMLANPIGLLLIAITAVIAAIGLLIYAFSSSTSETEKASEANKKLNQTYKDQIETLKALADAEKTKGDILNTQGNLAIANAKLRGASEKEIGKITAKFANEKREFDIAQLIREKALLRASAREYQNTLYQAQLDRKIALDNGDIEVSEYNAQVRKAKLDLANYKTRVVAEDKLLAIQITTAKALDEVADKGLDKVKTTSKAATVAKITDWQSLEDELDENEEAEEDRLSNSLILEQENLDATKLAKDLALEQEIERFADETLARIEADRLQGENEILWTEKARVANLKATEDKLDIAKSYSNSANDLASAVFAISDGFGKQDEKSKEKRAKKQFQVNKVLQLGASVVDTAKAITSSLVVAPLASPQGIPSLIATAAMGAASIAKIASAQYKSSGSGSTNIPNIGSGDISNIETSAPTNTFIGTGGDTGGNANNEAGSNQSPIIIQNNILESDITNAQDNVASIEQYAQFGLG